MWKNVTPGNGAGIRTHDLQNMSLLTWLLSSLAGVIELVQQSCNNHKNVQKTKAFRRRERTYLAK